MSDAELYNRFFIWAMKQDDEMFCDQGNESGFDKAYKLFLSDEAIPETMERLNSICYRALFNWLFRNDEPRLDLYPEHFSILGEEEKQFLFEYDVKFTTTEIRLKKIPNNEREKVLAKCEVIYKKMYEAAFPNYTSKELDCWKKYRSQ